MTSVIRINREINCTGYAVNSSKSYARDISERLTRIEFASNLVEEGILTEEQYKNFVIRQKAEIKDALAYIYSYLHLEDVEGHQDHVFAKGEDERE